MRLFAKPVVLVVLLLAACSPFATPTASPATNASPTTPGSTPGASGSPSTPASLTSPPMWIDTTPWTTFFSDRYEFSMGYPSDWTVVPADHDWTLAEDANNWLSTGHEVFLSPAQDIRVSVWEVHGGTTLQEQFHAMEAWVVDEYCPQTNDPSCTGIHDRAVPLCIETWDCHPGLMVPFESDLQAFLRAGVIGTDMRVVAVWRPESHPSVDPYGGAQRLLESFLYTMEVCPRLDRTPQGCPSPIVTMSDANEFLVRGSGHTLYVFTPDNQGEPTCYDRCAAGWLPVEWRAVAGKGVDESLLGTTTRSDGTVQATYNGWPLYTRTGDLFPGDRKGQGIDDLWWVIDANGNTNQSVPSN
jgi:predicted lipoprotein with Yx(FWY)xxD motif